MIEQANSNRKSNQSVNNIASNDSTDAAELDDLDDILVTTGAAFLGTTLGCAGCHTGFRMDANGQFVPGFGKLQHQAVATTTHTVSPTGVRVPECAAARTLGPPMKSVIGLWKIPGTFATCMPTSCR
jgi:hypothetical protein